MAKPVVAIVGRPNVGKSSLFNALYGERISIVHDTPGVTRDRIYAQATWRDRDFLMIDTGGIEPESDDIILKNMRLQAEIAIETADVIVFMCDLKTGVTAADEDISVMLRKAQTPVVLAVNKVDAVGDPPPEFYEFYNLGLDTVIPVSAAHRLGLGDLLDAVFENFPEADENEEDDGTIRVALIGRPNAGKSSLSNTMLGQDRSIVSDIAGTTRDSMASRVPVVFSIRSHLLMAMMQPLPALWAMPATLVSCSVMPTDASIRMMQTSDLSTAARALTIEYFSISSSILPFLRMPAVSTIVNLP